MAYFSCKNGNGGGGKKTLLWENPNHLSALEPGKINLTYQECSEYDYLLIESVYQTVSSFTHPDIFDKSQSIVDLSRVTKINSQSTGNSDKYDFYTSVTSYNGTQGTGAPIFTAQRGLYFSSVDDYLYCSSGFSKRSSSWTYSSSYGIIHYIYGIKL